MSDDQGKTRGTVVGHHHEPQHGAVVGHHHEPQHGAVVGHHHEPQYGTFQGVSNYPPPPPPEHHHHPPPAFGFPQPVPPPGATESYQQGYQTVPGYAVAEGRPVRERRLPCCGIGFGWFMFIIGFFLAAIPWYVGAIILMCSRLDHREKPGYIACTIAAIVATLAIVLGATKGADDW